MDIHVLGNDPDDRIDPMFYETLLFSGPMTCDAFPPKQDLDFDIMGAYGSTTGAGENALQILDTFATRGCRRIRQGV